MAVFGCVILTVFIIPLVGASIADIIDRKRIRMIRKTLMYGDILTRTVNKFSDGNPFFDTVEKLYIIDIKIKNKIYWYHCIDAKTGNDKYMVDYIIVREGWNINHDTNGEVQKYIKKINK